MRIVLINHCHPATPHICATRMREFARALAARGHAVALVTETLAATDAVPTPRDIAELLVADSAPSPMLVACPPVRRPTLRSLRAGLWPAGFQQAMVAYQLLVRGGMFSDWRLGAMPYVRVLAEHFRPDVVWASFGNTESWTLARALAKSAGCPWVADIKDFWSSFVPGPFRAPLAKRYRDAAAFTALSRTHADASRPWFAEMQVIYSGFPATAIRRDGTDAQGPLTLTLTGSLYGPRATEALLSAIARWAARQDDATRRRLAFAYYGHESTAVGAALARARLPMDAKAHGFVPLDELQDAHRSAFVNLYVTSPRTFHHKTLELLAARRPIVAFPPDHAEAVEIAAGAGGAFANCTDVADVARALDDALAAFGRDAPSPAPAGLEELTWDNQAARLETLLEGVARARR